MADDEAPKMDEGRGFAFDGEKYRSASTHQKEWGGKIIAALDLAGDATVLDLGCGDGVLTARLAATVPRGRVLGIDASESMIATAKRMEGANLSFAWENINDMSFRDEFDLVFSNATLHWLKDHRGLLRRTFAALKPGGRLRFNFAGAGNCATLCSVVRDLMTAPRYVEYFVGFDWPWYMPGPEEYEGLVKTQAFVDVRVWGENADRHFANVEELVGWIDQPSIVPFLGVLAAEHAKPFRDEVVGRMIALTRQADGRFFETFRRVNVSARKPA